MVAEQVTRRGAGRVGWVGELAARGYTLGLTARRMQVLERVSDEIRTTHPLAQSIELLRLDVDATKMVGPALHALFAALGGADIVVVNAGSNEPTFVGKRHLTKQTNIIQLLEGICLCIPH